ncbi:MAG: ECF RNA polymerase sigma factor SigE [Lentisphaerae bacterium ADurb.BinA184]|nr:MAG: ECF RNA polymerase sigma factor SigE [Lentisphaerae bacterium ADurb.BinA184]
METVHGQTGVNPAATPEAPAAGTGVATTADGAMIEQAMLEFETPLLRYVGQVLGRQYDEAQDVVQDVFIRLHRQLESQGRGSIDNLRCWLYRVAHNLAMDCGRRRGRQRRLEEKALSDPVVGETLGTQLPGPARDAMHREACENAMREVDRLPDEQRHVLLLKIIQGLTLREISEITGLKIGTVNYRLTQALATLASRLKGADTR